MKNFIKTLLFSKKVSFQPIDPLADGLREEIIAEEHEPQAIHLDDDGEDSGTQLWSATDND